MNKRRRFKAKRRRAEAGRYEWRIQRIMPRELSAADIAWMSSGLIQTEVISRAEFERRYPPLLRPGVD